MNYTLSDFKFHSFNNINLFQKYEICQQQSQCYGLIPPPRPPIFPKLNQNNSSSLLINLRQRTDSIFILFGLSIALIFTCLFLFLLAIKLHFYCKLRKYSRRTKHINIRNESASMSSMIPISYNSLTPLTPITNQFRSLSIANNVNMDYQTPNNNNNLENIYDQVRSSIDSHRHCSCTLPHNQYISTKHQLRSNYSTCERIPSKIVCQNCLVATLHRKQKCLCHHFFVPIK